MMFSSFAGRSSLRSLHQTVQRNILLRHRRANIRCESTKPKAETPKAGEGERGINGAFGGTYWAWIEPIKIPFRGYSDMQARSPLMTQLETTLIIYFLGDLAAQSVQTSGFQEDRYEPIRGFRAMLVGGIFSIPSYKWFLWLGRHFNYDTHVKSLAAKIVISQMLFTPVFNTYFFSMHTILAGGSLQDAAEKCLNTVPVSWKNSWKLWPAVTAFSFTFVAPQHRSAVAGVVAIFWQTYLSWLNRRSEDRSAAAAAEKKVPTRRNVERRGSRAGKAIDAKEKT